MPQIEDDLSKVIDEIQTNKSDLQLSLDKIHSELQADKLSLMVRLSATDSFIQTYQIGFEEHKVEKYIISRTSPIIEHLFTHERMVFVTNLKKLAFVFEEVAINEEFSGAESMVVYPIKIFDRIRALIFIAFKHNSTESL